MHEDELQTKWEQPLFKTDPDFRINRIFLEFQQNCFTAAFFCLNNFLQNRPTLSSAFPSILQGRIFIFKMKSTTKWKVNVNLRLLEKKCNLDIVA